jgi:hypothetical protein
MRLIIPFVHWCYLGLSTPEVFLSWRSLPALVLWKYTTYQEVTSLVNDTRWISLSFMPCKSYDQ